MYERRATLESMLLALRPPPPRDVSATMLPFAEAAFLRPLLPTLPPFLHASWSAARQQRWEGSVWLRFCTGRLDATALRARAALVDALTQAVIVNGGCACMPCFDPLPQTYACV
jgi:hypothetical protein